MPQKMYLVGDAETSACLEELREVTVLNVSIIGRQARQH